MLSDMAAITDLNILHLPKSLNYISMETNNIIFLAKIHHNLISHFILKTTKYIPDITPEKTTNPMDRKPENRKEFEKSEGGFNFQ